jgi:hypothetical protein
VQRRPSDATGAGRDCSGARVLERRGKIVGRDGFPRERICAQALGEAWACGGVRAHWCAGQILDSKAGVTAKLQRVIVLLCATQPPTTAYIMHAHAHTHLPNRDMQPSIRRLVTSGDVWLAAARESDRRTTVRELYAMRRGGCGAIYIKNCIY